MTPSATPERRIGVYVCYCGGNISDYVDVEQVAQAVAHEAGVIVSRTHMFTCSDAAQQEIIQDIQEKQLNGLVIASCSPKLHMFTFRAMAERAGINPYQYIQVNLREQVSWAHTHERPEATAKGIAMVKAGIAKSRLSEPLKAIRVNTKPRVAVIGAGITGLKTALALADLGLAVDIMEQQSEPGGWIAEWGMLYPTGQSGPELVQTLVQQVKANERVKLYLGSEVVEKGGNLGDFTLKLKTPQGEQVLNPGAIVIATGFEAYVPKAGEFGFGHPQVMSLDDLKRRLGQAGPLTTPGGKVIDRLAYIYCVGSRQKPSVAQPKVNTHCSRACCTVVNGVSNKVHALHPHLVQYHLFRDLRTYGKHERVYGSAREQGAIYLRYDEKEPPQVSEEGTQLKVLVRDQLTASETIELSVDAVILVTGMQARANEGLNQVFKVPIDKNGFYKEIHPKLRPVETVIDGLFIAGAAQSPRLISEAVSSGLAAASKSGALVKKGYVDLEPMVAIVDTEKCTWCGKCQPICPYRAIERIAWDQKEVAEIIPFLCKGCGACIPVCPESAIDLKGYTDEQIRSVITALGREANA